MVSIRDEKRIQRMKQIGQWASLLGMLALVGGLVMAFTALDGSSNIIFYQLLALMGGWMLSQVGIYLAHRYVRDPRPDQVLDQQVKKVARDGRFYHFLLPASHVLLTPQGIIVFIAKFQSGNITVQNDKWRQSGMGFLGLRRIFGQESLGNPTREAESAVAAIASYLRKNAPEVEEVRIAPVIVFTTKQAGNLDLDGSPIPAMHFAKLKTFLRQQRGKDKKAMSAADYEAIKAAFDKKAAHLVEEIVEDEMVEAS
jgi:hypothetical protein